MSEVRRIEGVTQSVSDAMNAVEAQILREDGLLLRRCECGVAHPVGHLHRHLTDGDLAPMQYDDHSRMRGHLCCAKMCCVAWREVVSK